MVPTTFSEKYKGYSKFNKNKNGRFTSSRYNQRTKKIGPSFFQRFSDFFRYDYCPEIKFAKSKTNTYTIEFLDVYKGMISGIAGKPVTFERTDTLKVMKGIPEFMLELDPVATKNYKKEQEEMTKLHLLHDPYGEEEWNEDDKKVKRFKWDNERHEWIKK